jgi:cytochrome c-type biogenesis protein CcmE
MAQATWEKASSPSEAIPKKRTGRVKFLIGGGLILAAVVYLLISGTLAGAQYFMTVDELTNNPAYVGKSVRMTGVVIGDTIQYDAKNLIITFSVANVPNTGQDLAAALHAAASDPKATRLQVRVEGQVKPDLLQHEAQAILTGTLGKDGVFHANELLLKCPTRFQNANPQATGAPGA